MNTKFHSAFRAFAPALAILAVGLWLYAASYGSPLTPRDGFHAFCCDNADYRYLAEHFFELPHDLSTYGADFHNGWGKYLDAVPFRDLGVGSYELLMKSVFSGAPNLVMPLSLKVLLVAVSLFFFAACRRRFGTAAAVIALAILTLRPAAWALTDAPLSEPFLRILFLLLLCPLLVLPLKNFRPLPAAIAFITIVLFAAHVKAQWMFLGLLVLPVWTMLAVRERQWKCAGTLVLGLVAIPLSLSLIHGIGWNDFALVHGSGLHALWKTDGQILSYACARSAAFQEKPPLFCETGQTHYGTWGEFMDAEKPDQNMHVLAAELDRISMQYFLERPTTMLREFAIGFRVATNFPDWDTPWRWTLDLLDLASVMLLFVGLLRRETLLLSFTTLSLWLVPAITNMFAIYDPRYHRPMAGLPLAMATMFALHLVRRWIVQWKTHPHYRAPWVLRSLLLSSNRRSAMGNLCGWGRF